jgi:monoterpene epsilon-lactone hydrolase
MMSSGPSTELAAINEMLAAMDMSAMTLEEQRRSIEAMSDPPGAGALSCTLGGVPCEWVAGRDASAATIIAVRGGGYCIGSLRSNRRFANLLAETCGINVLNVGYRNAPEHPHPAALDDVVGAYRGLLDDGVDPATIALVGNSAGGGLTLACLLALRDAGDRLPACAAVISPWTDLANTGPSVRSNAATEVMLDPAAIDSTAALYARSDELRDPYVSPLYGDPTGLPPVLVHVSGAEILLDDSLRFVDRCRAAGVDVTLHVQPHVPHVWHLFTGLLPEADEAMILLGLWLLDHLP